VSTHLAEDVYASFENLYSNTNNENERLTNLIESLEEKIRLLEMAHAELS
jgi:hypothetical protein